MPAPIGSTLDATAVSPTRRQRVSIMSGLARGVRRISGAVLFSSRMLGNQVAPVSTSESTTGPPNDAQARPQGAPRAPPTAIARAVVDPDTAGRSRPAALATGAGPDASSSWARLGVGDHHHGSPAGRTRTSADSTAGTKVVTVGTSGATGTSGHEDSKDAGTPSRSSSKQGASSGWALANSERPQSRFSSDIVSRPTSAATRVAPVAAATGATSRSGAGVAGRSRASGRRRSSVHYRVGGVPVI